MWVSVDSLTFAASTTAGEAPSLCTNQAQLTAYAGSNWKVKTTEYGVELILIIPGDQLLMGLGLHASQVRSRILGHKHCNCRRDDLFLPETGFIRILSRGKPGTPPCKSGQLEKDLGLEVSSARHAARLMIFEIMRSFLVGSSAPIAPAPGFAIH